MPSRTPTSGGRGRSRGSRRGRRFAAIGLAAAHWTAVAQDLPAQPAQLPTVRVEGQRESGPASDARPDTTLRGEALQQKRSATLGATLQDELGVANASFGPGVGLPVIRGMTGPRVRILLDGLGSHDASSVSPDHAIAIDPLLADEVRILRGPAVVRHGGAAIGGAVEVLDGRVPSRVPKAGMAGGAEVRFNGNGSERASAFKLDAGAGGFVVHVDGVYRERGNLAVPGAAIDEAAIVRQFGLFNATNTFGRVANTNGRTHGATVGASLIGDRGYIGASYGQLHNAYGIPAGAHSHSHGPGPAITPAAADVARIDMKQERHDIKGRLRLDGPVKAVEMRVARVNYQHAELDGGVAQTLFSNDVVEGRMEAEHAFGHGMTGSIGVQFVDRTFAALGAEAFVPRSSIRGAAGYLVQRLETGPLALEFGARRERQSVRPDTQLTVFRTTVVQPGLTHGGESFSLAATLQLARQDYLTATLSRAKRSPDVQELFALGPHLATRTFDIGNNRLRREVIEGADLGASFDRGTLAGKVNVYRHRARDYIYQRNAGLFYDPDIRQFRVVCVRLDECLPVQRYEQDDAVFKGFELQGVLRFAEVPAGLLEIKPFVDRLSARLRDGSDVPRLPPWRYGFEVALIGEDWTASLRHTRARAQDRPGVNETQTSAYEQLNALYEHRWRRGRHETTLFVQGRNLLDREIRNSVSFLRNYAPEPGRSLEVGVRRGLLSAVPGTHPPR